jgi:curli production assembly/transport component CsgG
VNKKLLEVETGYTTNEPVQMAVTEAIEKGFNFSWKELKMEFKQIFKPEIDRVLKTMLKRKRQM